MDRIYDWFLDYGCTAILLTVLVLALGLKLIASIMILIGLVNGS